MNFNILKWFSCLNLTYLLKMEFCFEKMLQVQKRHSQNWCKIPFSQNKKTRTRNIIFTWDLHNSRACNASLQL